MPTLKYDPAKFNPVSYTYAVELAQFFSTKQPWETKSPDVVSVSIIMQIMAEYHHHAVTLGTHKVSFSQFLFNKISKLRIQSNKNPFLDDHVTFTEEFRIIESANGLQVRRCTGLNAGWRSHEFKWFLDSITILKGFANPYSLQKFIATIENWRESVAKIAKIQKLLSKVPKNDTEKSQILDQIKHIVD